MSTQSPRKRDKSYPANKFSKRGDLTDILGGTEEETASQTLRIDQIVLPYYQPRRYFDPEKLARLAESIKQNGILENLLVRPAPNEQGKYELVSGERRLRAAQQAGLDEVPVQIHDLADQQVLEISLIENLQREDLNPVEETEGIIRLLSHRLGRKADEIPNLLKRLLQQQKRSQSLSHNVMGQQEQDMSHNGMVRKDLATIKQVFNQLGRMNWESFTSNRLPLLKLPPDILEALRKGQIEYTKAKIIAKIGDREQRTDLLNLAIQNNLSTRAIRDKVKAIQQQPESSEEEIGAYSLTRMDHLTKRIKKEKPWQNAPKNWQQIQSYLQAIENLL